MHENVLELFRKRGKRGLLSAFTKISAADMQEDLKYFGEEEEEVNEERGDTDTSLVEVGLSSAQYGALEVESVRMFLCELASECLFIKVFVLCMYFFFFPPALLLALL